MLTKYPLVLLISLVIWMPFTLFATYGISVANNHTSAVFPYISETGSFFPDRCIFGQLLDIAAFLCFGVLYIRFSQIRYAIHSTTLTRARLLHYTNNFSFFLGLLSCLGITMVGNFQEKDAIVPHLIGALMAFFLLLIYCWIQTVLAYRLRSIIDSSIPILIIRILLCLLGTANIVMMFTFGTLAGKKVVTNEKYFNRYHWRKEDGGWVEHLVSTSSEWSLVLSCTFYVLTFFSDFKNIEIFEPQLRDKRVTRIESFNMS